MEATFYKGTSPVDTTTGTIPLFPVVEGSLKSERIFLVTASLVFGLIASGCRERNPAYIKADASTDARKDAAESPDRSPISIVDTQPSDTPIVQPEAGRPEVSVDVADAGADAKPDATGAGDAYEGGVAETHRDTGSDLRIEGDGPPLSFDVSPDERPSADVVPDVSPALDTAEPVREDASLPIPDVAEPDTAADGPPIILDAPEAVDGPEADASEDVLTMIDAEAVDTAADEVSLSDDSAPVTNP
jgi:hypothetical protein